MKDFMAKRQLMNNYVQKGGRKLLRFIDRKYMEDGRKQNKCKNFK